MVVSTSAFGLGIDDHDISVTVRVGCPSALEEMVQMFGRGGRDGRQAEVGSAHMYALLACA